MKRQRKKSPSNSGGGYMLFFALLFCLAVVPLLEALLGDRGLLRAGISAVILFAVIRGRREGRVGPILLAIAAVEIPVTWVTLFVTSKPLFVGHCILGSALLWYVGGLLLVDTIRNRTAKIDSVFGAISAYLLFGMAWAMSYWGVDSVVAHAFSNSPEATGQVSTNLSQYIYFSFVTMTSLGYGDVSPTHPITRTLAWIQAVTGQFYVAVVIAWLVSALPRPTKGSR